MGLDWDDIRFFLAVAEAGSTIKAARALGVAQTTCARRIDSLEATLGLTLFDRRSAGYTLSRDGERLLSVAREMGRSADAITAFAGQATRGHGARIRLSVGDLLVPPVVHPALASFRKAWPDVRVELAVESREADIMKGEADMAIRPGLAPDDPELIIRRLGDNPVGVYCTRGYVERHGLPANLVEFLNRPFACMEGRALNLITMHFPEKRPGFVASTTQAVVDAVALGEFAAILPSPHARHIPDILECFRLEMDTGSVWLVYHPDLRKQHYARDLAEALSRSFEAWQRTWEAWPRP